MIKKYILLVVILPLILSSFSCAPGLEKPTPTPTPEEATPPPRELASTGDFSVAIASVQREEDKAILRFSITKVGDTNAGAQILPVTLIDDHGNEYKGELGIDLGLKEISEAQSEVTEAAEEVDNPALREKLLRLNELTEGQKGELARELSKQFKVSTESILEWFEEVASKQGTVDILNAIPKGFTYVESLAISMPKIAPIDKVRLGEKEIDFAKLKFGEPQYLTEFGSSSVAKGQKVRVGEWLSFTMGQIEPELHHWELPIEVGSTEYNPSPAEVKVGVQHEDGTISWTSPYSTDVPAASKSSVKLSLPIPSWVNGGPPQPRTLLLVYRDKRGGEQALRMCAMTAGELLSLVGQGPKEMEDLFVEAYQRNGGKEVMGNPLGLPHWFAGGDKLEDEYDVLVQEFPSVSEFGKSAIVWDKQGNASEAYVVRGLILEEYLRLGGPYFKSKAQGISLGAPTGDGMAVKASDSYFKTEGMYNAFQGGAIASSSGQTTIVMGKIYEKWEEKGLTKGALGFPTGDEKPAPASGAEGFKTTGWVQDFEGGHVLYVSGGKRAGKAFEVHGPVAELYMKGLQGSAGYLGFPNGDQYRSPTGFLGANFEGGFIATADGTQWEAFPYEPGKIAFVSDRDRNQEIYIMDTSGENEINLTRNLANDYSPTWSPDGTKIAFVSDREGSPALYLMKSDGSNVTRVCQTSSEGGQLSWFPNRATIAFNSGSGTRNVISIVDVDGKNLQHLARHSGFNAGGPTVSPRGEQIAYMLGTIRGGTLRVMDVAGKALREFTFFFYGAPFNPSWSPDGKWIAFFDLPKDGIYLVGPNSGSVIQLTKAGRNPSWSADGQWIVFDSGRSGDLQIAQSDGKISRNVSEGGGNRWDPSWGTPGKGVTLVPTAATKADLVDALNGLRDAMLKKVDSDIDNTAIAFTDVKDYWRSKRWADIFTAPLRILEDTLIFLAKASDVTSLATKANTALNDSEAAYQVLATIMMLQDLQEVGEKLHYGLDGPTYVSSVESMLEAADATYVPPFGDDWQNNYRVVVENHLYGITEDTPLVIPRKSTTPQRRNIEFVKGALQVRSSITRTFDNLTAEIESRELPEDFPIDEVIAQIEELKKQVIKSMGYSVELEYKTHFQDPVKTNLGAVGSLYRAFGQIAGKVAEKLEIEQRVEVFKLVETVESAALLYTIAYKIPGAEEIRIAQKATTLAELSVNPYENTFYSDPEEEFYMLPQEMVLTLPGELSNLWMIADDTDQYLRYLLGEVDFVTKPKITIIPTVGVAGTEVQISGTGFGGNRDITIIFGGDKIFTEPPSLKTDNDGCFSGMFITPECANGTYEVKASDGTNEADANFSVVPAASLNPNYGQSGTEIEVCGTGFAADAVVTITFDDTVVATTAADSDGDFSAAFIVPPSVAGTHVITITDGHNMVQHSFTIES